MKCIKIRLKFNIFAIPIYNKYKNTMKNSYLFFLLIASIFTVNGQENCDDASAYIGNAYSHVKDSYESNNIDHLKYYANRSLESLKLSKKNMTTCDCKKTSELINKAMDALAKVETSETYEDGRYFVKRAKELNKESIIEIDNCSSGIVTDDDDLVVVAENTLSTPNNTANQQLTALQQEELKLRQQQEALKLKQEQLKQKLAQQQDQETRIKKEKLILSYKNTLSTNIKTYNETLEICDCEHKKLIEPKTLDDMSSKSIKDIKNHYQKNLKTLASNYLSELDLCED